MPFQHATATRRLSLVDIVGRSFMASCAILIATRASAQLADPIDGPITQGSIAVDLAAAATGVTAPLLGIAAPDGTDRLFIVQQTGQVRIIENGSLQVDPFLNVSSRLVTPSGELGFLGLAFHPDYANEGTDGFGKVYTYTSEPGDGGDFDDGVSSNHQSVIAEWQVDENDPDAVDPSSRRELLRVDEPQSNHNAGMIAFGPDGYLYIALGDGGSGDDQGGGHPAEGNGQDLGTILGSIVRIDPFGTGGVSGEYGVPTTNPFVEDEEALDEIFAYGLRNPYRFSFARDLSGNLTSRMIIGDVGQNDIEEVDVMDVATDGGTNFGWRVKEGTFTFDPNGTGSGFVSADSPGMPADLTDPVLQYDHDEGISVIGGFVYYGTAIPALRGKYVFGDYLRPGGDGRLFYADLDDPNAEVLEFQLLDGDYVSGGDFDLRVKGFGQDKDGEIYVMGAQSGSIGSGNDVVLRLANVPGGLALGDMNGDGTRDDSDVSAMILALTDRDTFETTYNNVDADLIGDFDGNGQLDFGDLEGFSALVSQAASAQGTSEVPEPAAALLLLSGVVLVLGRPSFGFTTESRRICCDPK